jgi:hypothetical protein
MANRPWKEIARNDPQIKTWYSDLRKSHPDEPVDVVEHMERSIREFDGGKGKGYDYKTAIESGERPSFVKETNNYRWMSDTKKGKWLKGEQHPTRHFRPKKKMIRIN